MTAPAEPCCVARRLRLTALSVGLTMVCCLSLLWHSASEAGGAAFKPRVAALVKDKQLDVAVASSGERAERLDGPLSVELLDADGQVVATAKEVDSDAASVYRLLRLPAPTAVATARLRVTFGGAQQALPLAAALLVKGHETSLTCGQEFHTGSPATLSCAVYGVRTLTELVPLPGSAVMLNLRDQAGKRQELGKGRTNAAERTDFEFAVPDVVPGAYTLEVETRSVFGTEKLERPVRVIADAKVLLVSDRPIYQPGQVIHLRALALRPFDMRPVDSNEIQFEVEDPKGNKVFKRTFKTSSYGIASVDFQLADEVNMGDYHVRAMLGNTRAEKTVQVKRYVLPKFKVNVTADKTFYLPKTTVKLELQSDYFFGKPVARAKVEVAASTFDVAFNQFQTWKGETDANGHATLEIKLPDYFVGQPLQKGDALVRFEVKVLDSADHSETVTKSLPVSDQPVRVSLIAEGGKIVPNMDNRIFVAATYPDGSPAPNCEITLTHEQVAAAPQPRGRGRGAPPVAPPAAGEPVAAPKTEILATVKTNATGLAECTITPKAAQLRVANWGANREIETTAGRQQMWGPQIVFDVKATAKDPRGNTASAQVALNSQPLGDNVLLRLDKAIYQPGERMAVDIRTSAGLPTVYLDIVRNGQIMLSKWLEVKNGKALQTLDLPQNVFGSLEIHAYQMLQQGEIIRDSRVVYVQPRNDLQVAVEPGKAEFAPGEDAMIRFQVTDATGKPTAAALGVIIVDEAVYALQDLQPGLEKVYFTLQEELLKPQAQLKLSPNDTLDNLVIQPALPAPRQQLAEMLLTAVKVLPPKRFVVDPAQERQRRIEGIVPAIASQLLLYARQPKSNVFTVDQATGRLSFRPGLFADMVKNNQMPAPWLDTELGVKLEANDLTRLHKDFTADALGRVVTSQRMREAYAVLQQYVTKHKEDVFFQGRWVLPVNVLDTAAKASQRDPSTLHDAWGQRLSVVRLEKKVTDASRPAPFDEYELISAGPDRRFSSADDLRFHDMLQDPRLAWMDQLWWLEKDAAPLQLEMLARNRNLGEAEMQMERRFAAPGAIGPMGGGMLGGIGGGIGGMAQGRGGPGVPVPAAALGMRMDATKNTNGLADAKADQGGGAAVGSAAPRVREFFPETMLWQPALITDDKGVANLALGFADSITTWRLSASANSRGGALGNATLPLKVFQDFFVDIDLPVHLTQGDEIAFPVAVYNYLKTPQTVQIELQKEAWFELLDPAGYVRKLDLQPSEVTSIRFRIRAGKLGMQPLTVKAIGSKKSDAVKRMIDVAPNGQKFEKVVTDRLQGKIVQDLTIPANAVPDASKLLVKIYPGAMAQVVEGLDGMLRMPNGCFEQTSSSAYPNVLIVDYIRKNRLTSPDMLMRAEQYLNVGYQRLLTFERPGGGFDWWGREEPLIWLSAYGLQEFNDMARVYPIDRGIIDRTQAFLLRKMDKDGTWSNIGATHGETIASMGDPKLLLTSYVTWSLLESGYNRKLLEPSIAFIRAGVKQGEANAYVLALAANALAAYDAKDDSTLDAVRKLDKLREEVPQWQAIRFPGRGMSLTYGQGDTVSIETTALAALAMQRTGQFNNRINQALTYLVKAKLGNGTWGTTQATILALKALIGTSGANQKGTTHFTIRVDGQEAARGKVDEENGDVMQVFDLKGLAKAGAHRVELDVNGESNLMYQIVSRHFEPWNKETVPAKPVFDLSVSYDRTKLATSDLLHAKATLKYNGKLPTYMVMLDLGIAPGFTVDAGDFAEMINKNKVKKFEITARQVILYLGDVRPGEELHFEYALRARFPLRARTPLSTAYEYNAPTNRAQAAPVELTVEEKK